MENQFSSESSSRQVALILEGVSLLFEEVKQIKSLIIEKEFTEARDKLMTIDEASEFLHLKKQTVYYYVHKGVIPSNKRGGRLYFSKDDLTKWVKEGNKSTVY